MAVKKEKLSTSEYIFDGDQDAKRSVCRGDRTEKIRDTKNKKIKLAIMKDKQYNDYEFSNLKSA